MKTKLAGMQVSDNREKIMTTTTNNQRREAPNAADFLDGNYLGKDEIQGSHTVNIVDVWSEFFKRSGKWKMLAQFQEYAKPLILNKTNTRELVKAFGTKDSQLWRGPITLFHDPSVEYTGQVVGGLRLKAAVAKPPAELPRVQHLDQRPTPARVPHQYPNGAPAGGQLRRFEADVY